MPAKKHSLADNGCKDLMKVLEAGGLVPPQDGRSPQVHKQSHIRPLHRPYELDYLLVRGLAVGETVILPPSPPPPRDSLYL